MMYKLKMCKSGNNLIGGGRLNKGNKTVKEI